jgi:3-oxoacyl-[acyl-carrier-protein] synthase-3
MTTRGVGITALGSCRPARTLTSEEVEDRIAQEGGLRLPRGVIRSITGIDERRYLADDEQTSTLAADAATDLMGAYDVDPSSIDLLVFASAGRDMVEPATAHLVQHRIGTSAHCFDVTNACNSFLNGVDIARALVLAGRARRALVVTGEAPSRVIRWDVGTLAELRDHFAGYTFGDGGAAVLVEEVASGGILWVDAESHSEHSGIAGVFGGGSRHPRDPQWSYFRGDGTLLRQVFEGIGDASLKRLLTQTGWGYDDFAHILVHQVTLPYWRAFLDATGIPEDRTVTSVTTRGNLASATLPTQLHSVWGQQRSGDRTLMIGLGGGISITTMVVQKP